MNPVISPGDRVSVEVWANGFYRYSQKGTVLYWTKSGRISVKLAGTGEVKNVSPERVKKLADATQ
ncbi:hypothetical protein [Spirosoma foliorum]|uniref:Uncharacterized protein n=1 Tax=Spirosoma foliorum TaxID=2710596 RepID=A0A7G5GTU0_9BACT|nr:hypothetical protein [Spirosoma foliorum]QMW02282.1 hypothetical protein H3H32_30895 [Spirosoma foliorum]